MGLKERAQKVHSLPGKKVIYVSVSQVLLVSSIIVLLLLNFAVSLGLSLEARVLLSLWAISLLIGSYVLYRLVKEDVDFLDYMGSLVYYHKLRENNPALDFTNTLLFLGILLVSITPLLYAYLPQRGVDPTYASFTFFLGGILIAVAVSGYVILEKD